MTNFISRLFGLGKVSPQKVDTTSWAKRRGTIFQNNPIPENPDLFDLVVLTSNDPSIKSWNSWLRITAQILGGIADRDQKLLDALNAAMQSLYTIENRQRAYIPVSFTSGKQLFLARYMTKRNGVTSKIYPSNPDEAMCTLLVEPSDSNSAGIEVVGFGIDMVSRNRVMRIQEIVKRKVIMLTGYLVQANNNLFSPDDTKDYPALVIITFDRIPDQQQFMTELASRLFKLKSLDEFETEDEEYVGRSLQNEAAVLYRRRQVPLSLTSGYEVFMADINLTRKMMKDGYLRDSLIPCLVEQSPANTIEHVTPEYLKSITKEP